MSYLAVERTKDELLGLLGIKDVEPCPVHLIAR